MSEQNLNENLQDQARQHLNQAHQHQRWMSIVFFVDDDGTLKNGMVMHDFQHADFPTVLGDVKQWLDREFFKLPPASPLPVAPFLQGRFPRKEQNGEAD